MYRKKMCIECFLPEQQVVCFFFLCFFNGLKKNTLKSVKAVNIFFSLTEIMSNVCTFYVAHAFVLIGHNVDVVATLNLHTISGKMFH